MKKSTAGKMRNVVAASVLAALVPGMISMAEESITGGELLFSWRSDRYGDQNRKYARKSAGVYPSDHFRRYETEHF